MADRDGIGHRHIARRGTPCQDSCAHAEMETAAGPVLLAALVTEQGAPSHSRYRITAGGERLIQLVAAYLAEGGVLPGLGEPSCAAGCTTSLTWIADTALKSGHGPRDYSCTLLAALVGSTHAAFVQIGDGAIVVSHGEEDGWSYRVLAAARRICEYDELHPVA